MDGSTIDIVTAFIQMAVNFGVLGIVFWLFVNGKLFSASAYEEVKDDLDAEKKAHDLTRQALSLANERGNTSILTNQLILRALNPEKASEIDNGTV